MPRSVCLFRFATLWFRTFSRSIVCGHNDRLHQASCDNGVVGCDNRYVQLVFISSVPFQNKSLTTSVSSRGTHNEGVKQTLVGSCRTFICAKTTSGLYLYISSRNPKRSLFLHDRDNILNTPIMTLVCFDRFGGVNRGKKGSVPHFQQ